MAGDTAGRFDFFLSRRGSVAAISREVADVLTDKGYKVMVQDYDIALGANLVEAMHNGIKNARDLIVLYTRDYESSPYTRKEFTSFEAERLQSSENRRVIILRCEDVMPRGLLADNVYLDLVGIDDPEERKHRIVAAAEGHSQVRRPPPRPFVGVPPQIFSFTGRAHEFDRLDDALVQGMPTPLTQSIGRVAIQGLGGVGKTSLAIEYSHRFRYLYAGVCWCRGDTRAGLISSLAALAVTLEAAAANDSDLEKVAKAALRRLAEQRATWLLVYDNVAAPEQISDLLPTAGARLLITSRFSDWKGWAEEIALDVLPTEEAVNFLQNRAGRSDDKGARTLAESLGRLPLALDHAAATCRRTQMSFLNYAEKVRSVTPAAPRGVGYPRSVAATFDLALREVASRCPATEGLMNFLAHCGPERIPLILVEAAADDEAERLSALTALSEMSLVKHDPFEDGTPGVTVHRLVQIVARARADTTDTGKASADCVIARLASIYPDDSVNPQSWSLCTKLVPHVLAQRNWYPERISKLAEWCELLDGAGHYFHARAAYEEALVVLRDAVATSAKALGPDHPSTADRLNSLAGLLHSKGDLSEARLIYERVLAIFDTALEPEHAAILGNFSILLRDLGDLGAARPLAERALAISENTDGPDHPTTALCASNLAHVLQDEGDLTGARSLYERALAIFEEREGPEHPVTAMVLNSLATLFMDEDNFGAARPLCERALAIREKVLGPEHNATATSLNNLAFVLWKEDKFAEAQRLFERALVINEKTIGPGHPDTNNGRANLGALLLAMGCSTKALAFAESALVAHDKVLGRDHPWTAHAARITAEALGVLGRAAEAGALRMRYGLKPRGRAD